MRDPPHPEPPDPVREPPSDRSPAVVTFARIQVRPRYCSWRVPPRAVQRLRHPLQVRRLSVLRSQRVSPHFVRITFTGDDLQGFLSASFDDHLKLMLPASPGAALVLPVAGPAGLDGSGPSLPPGAARPLMRDYTPRRFDAATAELDIEFALHGDGPAANWAAQASPGDTVGVGGPRGSFVVPLDYDWHLLIGDESALPAIARRLEELPAGVQALVLLETGDVAERRALPSQAQVQLQWLLGGGATTLPQAVGALQLPAGEGYAWAAGEASVMAVTRQVLVSTHGLDKDHIRAAAYWKRGAQAHHENL